MQYESHISIKTPQYTLSVSSDKHVLLQSWGLYVALLSLIRNPHVSWWKILIAGKSNLENILGYVPDQEKNFKSLRYISENQAVAEWFIFALNLFLELHRHLWQASQEKCVTSV